MKSKQLKGVEFYQLQLSFRYFHYSFIRLKLNKCNWHVHLSLIICNVASKFNVAAMAIIPNETGNDEMHQGTGSKFSCRTEVFL